MSETANPKFRRKRRGPLAALSILLAVGTAIFAATPAQAAYVGNNYLRNWETGQCLTALQNSGVPTGWGVLVSSCVTQRTGNKYQTWEPEFVYHGANDVVRIRNIQVNL